MASPAREISGAVAGRASKRTTTAATKFAEINATVGVKHETRGPCQNGCEQQALSSAAGLANLRHDPTSVTTMKANRSPAVPLVVRLVAALAVFSAGAERAAAQEFSLYTGPLT